MTHNEYHPGCGCTFCETANQEDILKQRLPLAGELRSFACSRAKYPAWGVSHYNTLSASAAKVRHFHALRESFPEARFTDLRVRQAGPAHSSEEFIRCALRRGLPTLRCGDVVVSGGARGLVVGHNSSANFDILFLEGPHARLTLNVHPSGFSAVTSTPASGETRRQPALRTGVI